MKTESLKFPLHSELHLRLPKGSRITGVTVLDDITSLTIESEDDAPALGEIQQMATGAYRDKDGKGVKMEDRTIYSYFEGEKKDGALVLLPDEDPTLRKLGVVEIIHADAIFHIYEKRQ